MLACLPRNCRHDAAETPQTTYDPCGRAFEVKKLRADRSTDSVLDDTFDGLGRQINETNSTIGGLAGLSVYDACGDVVKSWTDGACSGTRTLDCAAQLQSADYGQSRLRHDSPEPPRSPSTAPRRRQ